MLRHPADASQINAAPLNLPRATVPAKTEFRSSLYARYWRFQLQKFASHQRILGVNVYTLVEDRGMERLLMAKLKRALALLHQIDRRRLTRLRRDVRRIVVEPSRPAHGYDLKLGVIRLDGPSLVRSAAEENAMLLVHEATHARIHRCGVAHTAETIERIEQICTKQEIAFARHLPESELLIEKQLRAFETARARRYWSREQRMVRQLAWFEREGVPHALLVVLGWIVRWRLRRPARPKK